VGDRVADRLESICGPTVGLHSSRPPGGDEGNPYLVNSRQEGVSKPCRLGGWIVVPRCVVPCFLRFPPHTARPSTRKTKISSEGVYSCLIV